MGEAQSLKPEYQTLKDELMIKHKSVFGECHTFAKAFESRFPELRYVYGEIVDWIWGRRYHAWCVDRVTGEIVDPTREQFPDPCGFGMYHELTPDEIPLGACMECGETILQEIVNEHFCSGQRSGAYVASLGLAIVNHQ